MWKHVLALIIKEFRALLKDKRSRIVLTAPPIIQLLVFGYAATYDLNRIPFAVYDEDNTALSRLLVDRFNGSKTFQSIGRLTHVGEVAPVIDNKQALMVLHIGPRFSDDLAVGQKTSLQVIVDGRNSNTALLVLNYVHTIVYDFSVEWALHNQHPPPPAELVIRALYNSNLLSQWFIVPGIIGLLTLVVSLLVTALSVAREREEGTFDQLMVTPLRPVEILIGKSVPGLIIGLIESTFTILIAVWWFEVPLRGQIGALYLGLFLFLLASIGIGLMISSLSVTQQQGLLGAFLFLVPAVILSGFATPIANMPEVLQDLTLINPLRYFLIIARGVFLEGARIEQLTMQFWPLILIASVSLASAVWLFRRRMY
ncbi:MAG: ABC transporter permease [Burkholderiales bacterium]|nr:ABC transporter permease [Nitrosomonas sp.]MCP5273367.1 ABC transporter permease [Burkholderiales bacterium]